MREEKLSGGLTMLTAILGRNSCWFCLPCLHYIKGSNNCLFGLPCLEHILGRNSCLVGLPGQQIILQRNSCLVGLPRLQHVLVRDNCLVRLPGLQHILRRNKYMVELPCLQQILMKNSCLVGLPCLHHVCKTWSLVRQQIQMRKLIKTSTVYLYGKSETNCVSTGLHYDETGEKTFIWGTNYQRTINTGTPVLCLISSCGNSHYISLVVQIWSYVIVSMAK